MDSVLNDARTELPRRLLGYHPVEDQLDSVWPPQVQIVADDLFEELTPSQRPVEDLRQAHFHLPDRQTPVIAGGAVFSPQGQRQPLQPFPKHALDVLWPQRIADLLQSFRTGARKKTVVQTLVADSALLQLPLGPLMAVQAQLGSPRRVAAHLQKQRPEVGIVNVEVVVVHIHGLIAGELELSVDLLALIRL